MCYTNSHGGLTKVVLNMDSMPKTWAQCGYGSHNATCKRIYRKRQPRG